MVTLGCLLILDGSGDKTCFVLGDVLWCRDGFMSSSTSMYYNLSTSGTVALKIG